MSVNHLPNDVHNDNTTNTIPSKKEENITSATITTTTTTNVNNQVPQKLKEDELSSLLKVDGLVEDQNTEKWMEEQKKIVATI